MNFKTMTWKLLLLVLCSLQPGQSVAAVPEDYTDYIHQRPENKKAWIERWCEGLDVCERKRFDRSLALVIGISEYKYLEKLKFTKNNPVEIKNFLLDEAGFDEVILLREDQATKEIIYWFMEDYIPKQFEGKKYSRFVFYFSGHGQDRKIGGSPVGYLRLKIDRPEEWSSSIRMTDVRSWATTNVKGARHSLFLIDSCFSALANMEYMGGEIENLDASLTPQQLMGKNATILMTAGRGQQRTLATEEWNGSLFTRALLVGLRGKANTVKDTIITSDELFSWMKGVIINEAKKRGHAQDPYIHRFFAGPLGDRGPFMFMSPGGIVHSPSVDEKQPEEVVETMDGSKTESLNKIEKIVVTGRRVTRNPGEVFQDSLKDGGLGPKMVVIPAGLFRMGDLTGNGLKREKPVHQVTIHSKFNMSQTEITFTDYDRFLNATGSEKPNDQGWGWADRPVINVNWHDAKAYADWLSQQTGKVYRLPTEVEWEYAARAGTETDYFWGNSVGKNRANCDGCGSKWDNKKTAPVKSFEKNAFGLYDMHGNVYEWVEDCWNESYTGAPVDGSAWKNGDCEKAVLRGGSWNFNPQYLRSSYRFRGTRAYRHFITGFRLVQD